MTVAENYRGTAPCPVCEMPCGIYENEDGLEHGYCYFAYPEEYDVHGNPKVQGHGDFTVLR